MIHLQAPADVPQATITLPNPQLGDTDGNDFVLNVKRSLTGDMHTYVKTNNQRLLKLSFFVARQKSLEIQNFIESYFGEKMKLWDWRDRVWVGIMEDPEFAIVFIGKNEYTQIEFTFRGQRIA